MHQLSVCFVVVSLAVASPVIMAADCDQYSICSSCTADSSGACAWCASSKSCMAASTIANSCLHWESGYCTPCEHSTCSACTTDPSGNCAWCGLGYGCQLASQGCPFGWAPTTTCATVPPLPQFCSAFTTCSDCISGSNQDRSCYWCGPSATCQRQSTDSTDICSATCSSLSLTVRIVIGCSAVVVVAIVVKVGIELRRRRAAAAAADSLATAIAHGRTGGAGTADTAIVDSVRIVGFPDHDDDVAEARMRGGRASVGSHAEEDDGACQICCKAQATVVFLPCKHRYCCPKCSLELNRRKDRTKGMMCPFCRQKVRTLLNEPPCARPPAVAHSLLTLRADANDDDDDESTAVAAASDDAPMMVLVRDRGVNGDQDADDQAGVLSRVAHASSGYQRGRGGLL